MFGKGVNLNLQRNREIYPSCLAHIGSSYVVLDRIIIENCNTHVGLDPPGNLSPNGIK